MKQTAEHFDLISRHYYVNLGYGDSLSPKFAHIKAMKYTRFYCLYTTFQQ